MTGWDIFVVATVGLAVIVFLLARRVRKLEERDGRN